MLISGTRKREGVSAIVERIRAKARAKRASHLELLRVLGNGAVASEARGEQKGPDEGSSSTGSPNEGMVSGDEAEPARRHLFRKKGKIYMIRNTINGKGYVGQTIQRPSARRSQHASGNQIGHSRSGKPSPIQSAIAKYGWKAFEWSLLESNIAHRPKEVLNERERHWIVVMDTRVPKGYNVSSGGQEGCKWTEEKRKQHSNAMQPWAKSEKSRARKREVWKDGDWRAKRCAERKVTQNMAENVQTRRDKWDAKRLVKLAKTSNPQARRTLIIQSRNYAKVAVRDAFRRGVEGRDLWAEFYARWGSDEAWNEWMKSGSCDAPRGCPLCTQKEGT